MRLEIKGIKLEADTKEDFEWLVKFATDQGYLQKPLKTIKDYIGYANAYKQATNCSKYDSYIASRLIFLSNHIIDVHTNAHVKQEMALLKAVKEKPLVRCWGWLKNTYTNEDLIDFDLLYQILQRLFPEVTFAKEPIPDVLDFLVIQYYCKTWPDLVVPVNILSYCTTTEALHLELADSVIKHQFKDNTLTREERLDRAKALADEHFHSLETDTHQKLDRCQT